MSFGDVDLVDLLMSVPLAETCIRQQVRPIEAIEYVYQMHMPVSDTAVLVGIVMMAHDSVTQMAGTSQYRGCRLMQGNFGFR